MRKGARHTAEAKLKISRVQFRSWASPTNKRRRRRAIKKAWDIMTPARKAAIVRKVSLGYAKSPKMLAKRLARVERERLRLEKSALLLKVELHGLAKARTEAGLSVKALAEKAGINGVLCFYAEKPGHKVGKNNRVFYTTRRVANKIAEALSTTVEALQQRPPEDWAPPQAQPTKYFPKPTGVRVTLTRFNQVLEERGLSFWPFFQSIPKNRNAAWHARAGRSVTLKGARSVADALGLTVKELL
jgi:hypothetical protein